MSELKLVNHEEFGLEEKKASELIGNLPLVLEERGTLQSEFDRVRKLPIEDSETWKLARELRLKIQKNRTQGIAVWHRTTKDFFLKGGQFVDAIKRKEIVINEKMESVLSEIENYEEIQRQKQIQELQKARLSKLEKYDESASERDLGNMEEDVFEALLTSKKQAHADKIEAEKRAEEERKEAERQATLYQERKDKLIPYWNFLKGDIISCNFGQISKKEFQIILNEAIEAKDAHDKKQEEIRKENERLAKEAKQREEAELKRKEKERKERAQMQAKLDAEKKERERIQREEEAKRKKVEAELEEKRKQEEAQARRKEEELQAELRKGDSEKVKDLISDLVELKTKYSFKSKKNQKMYKDVSELIDKVVLHIQK